MDRNGKRLGILVVGTGSFGAPRAAAVASSRGTRLVAVTDRDADVARAVADRHGADVAPDLDAGLERDDVEAVVVATPHADHGEAVRRGLEAGKHVLCEKPLSIDAREARDLALLADARRLR